MRYVNKDIIFILGSPRTGSTLIYQIMINFYDTFYFTNLTNNYFAKHPVVGSFLSFPFAKGFGYKSDHGKTHGLFGPSEGSYIFKNWFGGNQPSQTESCVVLPKKKDHMIKTFRRIKKITKKPIVTKNAWNCFRIGSLVDMFPDIKFIWIKRDIIETAYSDLGARYLRGSSDIWNSATTTNYKEIQKLPYWEQVVEQQYSYNVAIENDLRRFCPDSYLELWYEDLCNALETQIYFMAGYFELEPKIITMPKFKIETYSMNDDYAKICEYVYKNKNKFNRYLR